MTFNIRYANPDDGVFSWEHRKDLVCAAVKQEKPDILGVQEALWTQVRELSDQMPSFSWFGVGRDDGKEAGEFAPLFYRTELFVKRDAGFFWLSEMPDIPGSISWGAACTRIVTWLELQERTTDRIVFVFNTHFDHVSEEARVNAAKLLISKIGNIAGESDVILTGDFNCTPDDQAFKILSQRYIVTGPEPRKRNSVCTFVGFPAHISPGKVIDFIFITPGTSMKLTKYYISDFHEGTSYPSDHLPVISDVEIYKESLLK